MSPCSPIDGVWVSRHCLERLQRHYPTIGVRGALRLLEESTSLPQGEVSGFLRRSLDACRDNYLLTPGRAGILVVGSGRPEHTFRWTLVTYIGLSETQQDEARRLWGPPAT